MDGRTIRRAIKTMEDKAELLEGFRSLSKTEGGHLTDFGLSVIAGAKRVRAQQAFVAKLLDISASAVSQHYNK